MQCVETRKVPNCNQLFTWKKMESVYKTIFSSLLSPFNRFFSPLLAPNGMADVSSVVDRLSCLQEGRTLKKQTVRDR